MRFSRFAVRNANVRDLLRKCLRDWLIGRNVVCLRQLWFSGLRFGCCVLRADVGEADREAHLGEEILRARNIAVLNSFQDFG